MNPQERFERMEFALRKVLGGSLLPPPDDNPIARAAHFESHLKTLQSLAKFALYGDDGWFDLNTAPTDGSTIIVGNRDSGDMVFASALKPGRKDANDQPTGWDFPSWANVWRPKPDLSPTPSTPQRNEDAEDGDRP